MEQYANHIGYSDVNPWEVTRRVSDKTIEVREMDAERDPQWQPEFVPGGFSAVCTNIRDQRWLIVSNPANPTRRLRLHKDGQWRDAHGNRYSLNSVPVKFYDYNF